MAELFNRKTFNPKSNSRHRALLGNLRQKGGYRLGILMPSSAMRWALKEEIRTGILLDLGCGNSADCKLASGYMAEFSAFGVDLFPPDYKHSHGTGFCQADTVGSLPFADNFADVVISQAVLDLIKPNERELFFQEVGRVLKPNGFFACYVQELKAGHGISLTVERKRALKVWTTINKKPNGFVAWKD